jgi:glycogen debranching enzyme
MDIFQVRGLLRGKSGHYFEPEVEDGSVLFYYEGLDNRARTTSVSFSPAPARLEKRRAVWTVSLPPHGHKTLCTTIRMHVGASKEEQPDSATTSKTGAESMHSAYLDAISEHESWRRDCTRFQSDNSIFDAMLQTCTDDFYALRMRLGGETGIAAGVPWFAALFGRDSLISSYQTLLLDPDLACGTLRLLASYQGDTTNDERNEDPGKILHERRSGEMTNTDEVAFGRSYGSVDATPLFLILAHEYVKWTDDVELVANLHRHIRAAVKWILDYGDLDGDGLIEYMRRNPKGLFNQGWKDSGDAIRHKDGSIAQPPIALIEVQGYALRALAGAAEMLRQLGDHDLADAALNRSEKLRRLIDEKFWLEGEMYYALALDGHKQQCRVAASNPGHLLFARAVSQHRAREVAEKLVRPSLFSGWGVRTLSSEETSFNPMSYHCGSVWPHDNSLIAYGMTQYGMHDKAALILQSLYEAALRFRDYRLPELFCGFSRQPKGEPVHYPVSCSPQAWAAGTPFLLLTGLLGISPDAKAAKMSVVDPHLPPFLETLRIEHLRVANSRVTLDFKREGERTYCNVVKVLGEPLEVSVVVRP